MTNIEKWAVKYHVAGFESSQILRQADMLAAEGFPDAGEATRNIGKLMKKLEADDTGWVDWPETRD